ncbi:MAG: LamG domain-containing protein, partial [Proteobacteria bacterium]|nr:LamG domain-containing protein [Pseudomonadota bacterium]
MDGANGSTTFTDALSLNQSIAWNGNAVVSSAQSKFGGASGYFNSDSDNLILSPNDNLNLLASDWSMEFWYHPTGRHPIASMALSIWRDWPETRVFWIGTLPNGQVIFRLNNDYDGNFDSGGLTVIELNTWSHIAITRQGSTLRAFVNGEKAGEFEYATPLLSITDASLAIGSKGASDNSIMGYIDEVRITKGLARYTENFTPATEAFPNPEPFVCYSNGVNTGTVSANGTGWCEPENAYYVQGLATALPQSGTGINTTEFYENGAVIGSYDGAGTVTFTSSPSASFNYTNNEVGFVFSHGTSLPSGASLTTSNGVTFNGSSGNFGTVTGNATFNGDSYNNGTVNGTPIYNGLTGYTSDWLGEVYFIGGQPTTLDSSGSGVWNGQ